MKPKKKKRPSDYPLFSFRTSEEKKSKLSAEIAEVTKLENARLGNDEAVVRMNDITVMALEVGLKQLRKKYRKKS